MRHALWETCVHHRSVTIPDKKISRKQPGIDRIDIHDFLIIQDIMKQLPSAYVTPPGMLDGKWRDDDARAQR